MEGTVIIMTKNDTIHVRVDENVKINAERILAEQGLTISDAINMMLCQVNLTGGLPFQIKLPALEKTIVNSKADIEKKLIEADNDILNGNVLSTNETFDALEEKLPVSKEKAWEPFMEGINSFIDDYFDHV